MRRAFASNKGYHRMGIAPETVVAPPATTPPLHSLIASAVTIDEPEGSRWEAGFTFQPENCIESEAWNPCGECNELIALLYICADAGDFEVLWYGETTGPLPYNVSAEDFETAMNALILAVFGTPELVVTVTGGPGDADATNPYTITVGGPILDAYCETGVPPSIDPFTTSDTLSGGNCKGNVFFGVLQEPGPYKKQKKFYDGNQEEVTYEPFIIEVPYTCSSFGFQAADYEKRARRQLMATMHKALENEFWTGSINPNNLSLVGSTPNDDAHVLNPGGAAAPVAVSPGVALMLLSQALANCGSGGRGMIHATPALAERWVNLTAVQCNDKLITTCARGDIIVNGSGYPGTGPEGQPAPGPNEVWAYATGMVNLRLGDPEVYPKEFSEAFDRGTNTVTYRGEIVASAVHDLCCSFAVLVDLCGTV